MLGYPDSNQERQDQNLQCYHYTIAQYICSKALQRYGFFPVCKYFGIFFALMILKKKWRGPIQAIQLFDYFCKIRF